MENPAFEALGGMDGCRALSEAFYARVTHDPVLKPLFPGSSMRCAIEALAAYLVQFLGGPCEYSKRRWSLSLREAHAQFKIGERERNAWLTNMNLTLDSVPLDGTARESLRRFFERASADLIGTHAPAEAPVDDLSKRWELELAIDQAVAAVRQGGAHALACIKNIPRAYFERDPGALLSLLALLCGGEDPAMLNFVRQTLTDHPELVHQTYTSGHMLLHDVAAAGCAEIVELLLQLGADPGAADLFGHTPLYFAGNQCAGPKGAPVVRLLVHAGANVNAHDKVKRCTALHMAARRGNVHIAEALLDCGADIEMRDRQGDTPLRRAVNCAKPEVAALLVARGADIHSIGNRGLTPLQAVRGDAMRRAIHGERGESC